MRVLTLLVGLVSALSIQAQNKDAEFPGGQKALLEFLFQNVEYPAECAEYCLRTKVFIQATIESDGSASKYEVVGYSESKHPDFKKEALRVAKLMPRNWSPKVVDGENVKSYYKFPVPFHIQCSKGQQKRMAKKYKKLQEGQGNGPH